MENPPLQEGAMRSKNSTLTAPQVHRCAAVVLQDHLKLGDHGPKCRASLLFTLLRYAAARITSLSDACRGGSETGTRLVPRLGWPALRTNGVLQPQLARRPLNPLVFAERSAPLDAHPHGPEFLRAQGRIHAKAKR